MFHLNNAGQIHQIPRPHVPTVTPGVRVYRIAFLPLVLGHCGWRELIGTVVVTAMFTVRPVPPSVIHHNGILHRHSYNIKIQFKSSETVKAVRENHA